MTWKSLTVRGRGLDARLGIVSVGSRVLHVEDGDATVPGPREPESRGEAEDAGPYDEDLGVWMQ